MSDVMEIIDVKEKNIREIDSQLLSLLLFDQTTHRNIIWATDDYKKYGIKYLSEKRIRTNLISGNPLKDEIIKPRVKKDKSEQDNRSKNKAEVFTPSWVCNAQNNLLDEVWFGENNLFNEQVEEGWITNCRPIPFINKSWQEYVMLIRMEVSCGEAPYLTSRYDTVSGKYIDVKNRIGLLDRKLRVIGENVSECEEWKFWAEKALKSIYGYDWQGDNVILARENILFSIIEAYEDKYMKELDTPTIIKFAKIISWNIWQMDGIKYVIPNSCYCTKEQQITMFEEKDILKECEGCQRNNPKLHNGIYCRVMDWKKHKSVRFIDLIKEA